MGVDIPWLRGVNIPRVGGRYTMSKGVDIPCVRDRYTMGRWVDIPWVGGRYSMGRDQYSMGRRSIYYG